MANKHFDYDYQRGLVGENALKDFVDGTHEVKTDYRTKETGNFYIETYQFNASGRWPSGINVTTADYFVLASPTGEGIISLKTSFVKRIIASEDLKYAEQGKYNKDTNASEGLLLPAATLFRYMEFGEFIFCKPDKPAPEPDLSVERLAYMEEHGV